MSDERIHTDGIDDNDGCVLNPPHGIETYYEPFMATAVGGVGEERYLRVFMDCHGPTNIETRIPFSHLIKLGWVAPEEKQPVRP